MGRFRKNFYGTLLKITLDDTFFFEIPKIIENFSQFDKFEEFEGIASRSTPFVFRDKKNSAIVDVYYKNLHIYICGEDENRIIKMSLKKEEENWSNKNQTETDNRSIQIFLWYYVKVMDDAMFGNFRYISGNWNEYVFKELRNLKDAIYSLTDKAEFDTAYKIGNEDGNKHKLFSKITSLFTEEPQNNNKKKAKSNGKNS